MKQDTQKSVCCRKCGMPLIVGENTTASRIGNRQYICRGCNKKEHREDYQKHREQMAEDYQKHREQRTEYQREYSYRVAGRQPMSENPSCPSFLGIHIAEGVVGDVFGDVRKMPTNNPGYDIICGGDYMVDVKASCRRHSRTRVDSWMFHINRNQTAEYFLCIAFDNREDLNPEYIWLIPAGDVNDHVTIAISETTLTRWDEYCLDVARVQACCNTIRGKKL